MNKLMGLSIPVAFHGAGNVILNKIVPFQIYRDRHAFIAAPLISLEQRRLANLPGEMAFECVGTTIISSRGSAEKNMDVLHDILHKVREKFFV
jgi:hypothetical protein